MSLKMELKIEGAENIIDLLQSLPAEVVSKGGGPVRAGLRRGAKVIADQAKINLTRVVNSPGKMEANYGTGLSARSIIVKRKRPFGGVKGERFIVTVKPVEYPPVRFRGSEGVLRRFRKGFLKTNDAAFMLERGTSKQEKEPWLRPAFESKAREAIDVTIAQTLAAIDRVVKRMARQANR